MLGSTEREANIIFQGIGYKSVDQIPTIPPANRTREMRHTPPSGGKDLPSIVKTGLGDNLFILSYQGITLIPTREGVFLGKLAARVASEQSNSDHYTAFDIGTGTGVLALLIQEGLKKKKGQVVASDISGAALEVAEINFRINGLENLPSLRRRDMLEGLGAEFGRPDLIVSNPPFYTEGRYCGNGFEPDIALNGGPDGLSFYNRLFSQSAGILHDESLMILQIQDMNLRRILASLDRTLPGITAGVIFGPQRRICGLVLGSREKVDHYSDQLVSL